MKKKEHLMLCMFDTKCHLIADSILSIGTVNASLISPREIFLKAFEYHAVHVILVHNHPSGNPLPSRQDIEVTRKIVEGGRLLGIEREEIMACGDGNNDLMMLKEVGLGVAMANGADEVKEVGRLYHIVQ